MAKSVKSHLLLPQDHVIEALTHNRGCQSFFRDRDRDGILIDILDAYVGIKIISHEKSKNELLISGHFAFLSGIIPRKSVQMKMASRYRSKMAETETPPSSFKSHFVWRAFFIFVLMADPPVAPATAATTTPLADALPATTAQQSDAATNDILEGANGFICSVLGHDANITDRSVRIVEPVPFNLMPPSNGIVNQPIDVVTSSGGDGGSSDGEGRAESWRSDDEPIEMIMTLKGWH